MERGIERCQLVVPGEGWQPVERAGGHPHFNPLVAAASVGAFVGRHVGKISAHGCLHVVAVDRAAVGGIEAEPAGVGEPDLDFITTLSITPNPFGYAPLTAEVTLLGDRDAMVPVEECQTPLFLAVDAAPGEPVRLYFDAPREAPTSRGFAAVLVQGLDGATPEEVLATPNDFYMSMGLEELVTPMRMRGLSAMLARVKRRVAAGMSAGG